MDLPLKERRKKRLVGLDPGVLTGDMSESLSSRYKAKQMNQMIRNPITQRSKVWRRGIQFVGMALKTTKFSVSFTSKRWAKRSFGPVKKTL
jgi:hypothetical protein